MATRVVRLNIKVQRTRRGSKCGMALLDSGDMGELGEECRRKRVRKRGMNKMVEAEK